MVQWGFGRQLFFGVWCRLGTRRDALPLFCALISDGSCCLIPNVLVFRPIFLLLWTSNKYSLSFCRVIWAAWSRQKRGCMAIRSWPVRVISPDILFFRFYDTRFSQQGHMWKPIGLLFDIVLKRDSLPGHPLWQGRFHWIRDHVLDL